MANYSSYVENKIVDHITGRTAFSLPTAYVALFTTNPTMPAGTGGTETTYTNYARVALGTSTSCLMAAASGGSSTNSGSVIAFPQCGASGATITGFGIYDASSTGNLLYAGSCSLTVSNGVTPQFNTSALTVSLA